MPTDLDIGSIPFILDDGYPVIIPVDMESGDLRGGLTGDDRSRPPPDHIFGGGPCMC